MALKVICELKKSELIISDIPSIETSKQMLPTPVSKKIKNYVHFEKIQTKIASERDLISTLYLVLGYDCNLNCKHCCNPKNEKQQKRLTKKTLYPILQKAQVRAYTRPFLRSFDNRL